MERYRIGFGGGCHWCTEAVFLALPGIDRVEMGYIASLPPDDAFSEAVRVTYDPKVIELTDLIKVHLDSHASTSDHKMRKKYRSAIYTFSQAQFHEVQRIMDRLQKQASTSFVTRVLSFADFMPADQKYQNYYQKNPNLPFSKRHIEPKLKKIKNNYPA